MIPFLTSTYIRLGLAVGLVAVVAFAGWRVSAWHSAYEALPEAQAALKAEVACADGSECQKRVAALEVRQAAISQTVVSNYEAELESLRNRPVSVRTVRLCPEATDRDVRVSSPAGPVDGAGPGTGVVHGSAGPDIGPDLYQLARDADELAARLRGLQEFNRALSAPSTQPSASAP